MVVASWHRLCFVWALHSRGVHPMVHAAAGTFQRLLARCSVLSVVKPSQGCVCEPDGPVIGWTDTARTAD